jgi:hypothetical protein
MSPSAVATYSSAQATVLGKSTDVVVNPVALKHAGITVTAVASSKAGMNFDIATRMLAGTDDRPPDEVLVSPGEPIGS